MPAVVVVGEQLSLQKEYLNGNITKFSCRPSHGVLVKQDMNAAYG
jgi:hypothetical protein